MRGMDMPTGDGTAASAGDMTIKSNTLSLAGGSDSDFVFQVIKDRKPFTSFVPDMTKLMHCYAVRSDLTGYQHVHPTMAEDGTWTARLAPMRAGTWRFYAAFKTKTFEHDLGYVLGQQFEVTGAADADRPLPAPADTLEVDGYELKFGSTSFSSDMSKEQMLEVTVSRNGAKVADLEQYLGSYAHLTAIRASDMSFAHMHPMEGLNTMSDGPSFSLDAMFPAAGSWRLFLQFQTQGTLHLSETTVTVV
ncbi:hypothetical protein [Rhizocola hellebori]|nr:hypothetical protein [Rhizocola hellebori]